MEKTNSVNRFTTPVEHETPSRAAVSSGILQIFVLELGRNKSIFLVSASF
jgi:hypothetical protein